MIIFCFTSKHQNDIILKLLMLILALRLDERFFNINDPIFISTISSFCFCSGFGLTNFCFSTYIYKDFRTMLELASELFSLGSLILGSIIFISHMASIALRLIFCVEFFEEDSPIYCFCFSEGSFNFAINGDCLICKIFFFNSTVLRKSHYFKTFLNKPKLVSSSEELPDAANAVIFFYLPLPIP